MILSFIRLKIIHTPFSNLFCIIQFCQYIKCHQRAIPTSENVIVTVTTRIQLLADRTATQYDRLLASSCCPSVRLSVTLCIVALRVGVQR